jgi:hypothetical protein
VRANDAGTVGVRLVMENTDFLSPGGRLTCRHLKAARHPNSNYLS